MVEWTGDRHILNMQKETIKSFYISAPDVIKDAISSDQLMVKIEELSSSNKLNENQRNILGKEMTLRILGITKKSNLAAKIANELKIDQSVGTVIANSFEEFILTLVPEKVSRTQQEYVQSKLSGPESSLQSIPEIKTEQNILAKTVITEKQNDLPMVMTGERPKTELTFEERKKLVPNIPSNTVHYEGGKDPYREPI